MATRQETKKDGEGKGKSKGKGKKGKGKKGKRKFGFKPSGNPHLTLDQRKAALKTPKAKTKCNKCGETGHWAGDDACKKKVGMMAIAYDLEDDMPMMVADPLHHTCYPCSPKNVSFSTDISIGKLNVSLSADAQEVKDVSLSADVTSVPPSWDVPQTSPLTVMAATRDEESSNSNQSSEANTDDEACIEAYEQYAASPAYAAYPACELETEEWMQVTTC